MSDLENETLDGERNEYQTSMRKNNDTLKTEEILTNFRK